MPLSLSRERGLNPPPKLNLHVRHHRHAVIGPGHPAGGKRPAGTLLGIRARLEGFTNTAIGALMAAYFLGYVMGTFLVPAFVAGWVIFAALRLWRRSARHPCCAMD